MSKMVKYKLKALASQTTLEQVLQIMTAMGLKPTVHADKVRLESYTGQDSAEGRIVFDSGIIGGAARAQYAVLDVDWDANGVIKGDMAFHMDSWGVGREAQALAKSMQTAFKDLTNAIATVAKATKSTTIHIPGLSASEVLESFRLLGGRMASQALVNGPDETVATDNLASSYLGRQGRVARERAAALGVVTKQSESTTGLMQIGPKAKRVTVEIPIPNHGTRELRLGYIPPVAAISEVGGGVELVLPNIFHDGCREQLANVRNLALAIRAAQEQAAQHAGKAQPETKIDVDDGEIANFEIKWVKDDSPQAQRLAERAALVQSGQVSTEQKADLGPSRGNVNIPALKEQICGQAIAAGAAQFAHVYG